MKNALMLLIYVILMSTEALGQLSMEYYLPDDVTYDQTVPTPGDVLGFVPGERHVRHDQLVLYMKTLAGVSDRFTIQEYARTYDGRPLLLLTITSPENHRNIETIRQNQLKLNDPSQSSMVSLVNHPVITWMGYSVHGNEPSGANAALVMAYYLASAQGPMIEDILKNSVILLDPSINPDGLDRFAHWVNMHKGKHLNADPNHREHLETWPNGRTNYYWFDLNRDWMPVQHPESRGRIQLYQSWKPNVLTDHHEMGTNSTFFFQPGIPSRNFPLTPQNTFDLTAKIGEYHAHELNKVGSLYYARESFDDFYLGKGSTYPDIQGTIGILFEQASSRGHIQESQHGLVRFPFTIKNQFLTSISTMKAAVALRPQLHDHMRSFYSSAMEESARHPVKAYVFGDEYDPARVWHLLDILSHHKINVYELSRNITSDNKTFKTGSSYVVPLNQPQYRLIRGLFDTMTEFTDSLFYDVSSWTLPLAFNLDYSPLSGRAWNANLLGKKIEEPGFPAGRFIGNKDAYAFAFEWDGYYAPRALNRVLQAGLRVKVAQRPFSMRLDEGARMFNFGTIVITTGIQDTISTQKIAELMETISREDGINVYGFDTGLAAGGIDLGSPNFSTVAKPSVMIIGGSGVSGNDVGEIWHQMDQRWDMELSIVDIPVFNRADLSRYTTIIMVNGSYGDVSNGAVEKLKNWVDAGGTLILHRNAINWAIRNKISSVKTKTSDDNDQDQSGKSNSLKTYVNLSAERGAQVIGGSIFRVEIDPTHPLLYGYRNTTMPVFRNTVLMLEIPENPYASPVRYTASPLISGYISAQQQENLKESAMVVVGAVGSGRVIMMTDNPVFRAFWFGTNKLLANSIFFGPSISSQSTIR